MKKIFSAILLMAAMAFSVSTFVSCNDLTQEMEDVKAQATQNAASISALQSQIDALKTALATAQATADAAKKAGDDAAAAAAQAKADAIKEAKAECEIVKAALEAKIAEVTKALEGKVSQADLDAAVAAATKGIEELAAVLGAEIEGIEAELNKLGDFATKAELTAEVEKLIAADKDLQIQIDAIEEYMKSLTGAPAEDYVTAEEAKAEAEEVREMLAQLAARADGLEGFINTNSNVIETLVDTVDVIAAALEGYIESNDSRINEIAKAVAAAGEDVAAIEEALKAYMPETDAKIAGLAQSIADVNALLDETVEQVAERINTLESQMLTYYKALNNASEDLAAEIEAMDARVDVLEAGFEALTPKVETLAGKVNTIDTDLNTIKTLLGNFLRSIVFAPKTIVDGVEAIDFWSIAYLPMTTETKGDVVPNPYNNKKDALSLSAPAYAYYHFNPSSFDLELAYYTLLDRAVALKSGVSSLAAIEAYDYAENGTVEFTLRRENIFTETKANMIALEATVKNEETTTVRSDYALVYDHIITPDQMFIADKAADKIGTVDHLHFATTFADAKNAEYVAEYTLIWNKTLDLLPLVETCYGQEALDLADYGLEYRFYVAETKYPVADGATSTNQQTVIECTDNVNGTFKVKDAVQKEAIGRTPIVKVELVDAAGNIVRRAYVKILVDVERAADLEFAKNFGTYTYICDNASYLLNLDEEYMRGVYRTISNGTEASLSHEEFWNLYDAENAEFTVTKNGKAHDINEPKIIDGTTANGKATKKIQWNPSSAKVGKLGDGALFEATVKLTNKVSVSEYPAHVTFKLSFTMVLPGASDKHGFAKNEEYWNEELTTYVVNPSIPANPQDVAENFFYDRNIYEAFVYEPQIVLSNKKTCFNSYFRLASVTPLAAGKGVGFDGTNVNLDKASDDVKAAVNAGTLAVVFEYVVEFPGTGDIVPIYSFPATFVKPVNFNLPANLEVTDALDGGDTVEFGWNGLVSDWRGFGIISPSVTESIQVDTYFGWKKTCDKNHFTEGYYRLANEPKVEPVYGEYIITEEVKGYTASVEAKRLSFNMVDAEDVLQIIASLIGGASWEELATNGMGIEVKTTTFKGETAGDPDTAVENLLAVIEAANMQIEASLQSHWKPISTMAYWRYDETAVAVDEKILVAGESIKYVKDFIVVLPEYEYVAPELKPCTAEPTYTPTEAGILEGCWTSVEFKNEIKVEVDVPGAYYNFYGPFEGPTLDITKAYTDLPYNQIEVNGVMRGQLPSGVTLVQDGTSVKYVNVGSPVRYAYNIYIPATMKYGFGVLTGELVIKVNPINE